MKHTPAPWTVEGKYTYHAVFAENRLVAEVPEMANAALIAAAPELLTCLKVMLAHADTLQSMLPKKQSDAVFEDMKVAKALIAKATGEAK